MFSKIFRRIPQHKAITGIILLLIIIDGYFGYQKLKDNDSAVRYAIAAVEKGTLIVSVSGSGQISSSDQIDIKSKVSGDIVTERTLNNAYENGYNDVSTAFFKLSDYMKDLRDVLGME